MSEFENVNVEHLKMMENKRTLSFPNVIDSGTTQYVLYMGHIK